MSGYLKLATSLATAGAGKATETVSTLLTLGDRDALVALVRTEVDQVIGRMGLVREDELAALRRHVDRLERELADLRAQESAPAPSSDPASGAAKAPAKTAAKPAVKKRKKIVAEGGA